MKSEEGRGGGEKEMERGREKVDSDHTILS